jgi:hypothetical protein
MGLRTAGITDSFVFFRGVRLLLEEDFRIAVFEVIVQKDDGASPRRKRVKRGASKTLEKPLRT